MNRPSELVYARIMCDSAKINEQFVRSNPVASEAYKLMVDLWNHSFDVEVQCIRAKSHMTVALTILHVIQPQIYGMMYNFLLGNLPACYMSMRIIVEAVVDAVIASVRFYDLPFPDNLERLRSIEREGNLKFRDKCDLLIPAWGEVVVKDIKELWNYLSEYWAHARGIVKKLNEKLKQAIREERKTPPIRAPTPPYLPYEYDESDVGDIQEFLNRLHKLMEINKVLLEPFGEAEVKQ